jgi:hypothetical protein
MKYLVIYEESETGWGAYAPDLSGLVIAAKTDIGRSEGINSRGGRLSSRRSAGIWRSDSCAQRAPVSM